MPFPIVRRTDKTMHRFMQAGRMSLQKVVRIVAHLTGNRRHSSAGPGAHEALEPQSGWVSAIQGVAADLEALNRSTEKDFLSVGGKLMDFMSLARQISSGMSVLSELIQGKQGGSASAALVRIREDAQQMAGRMEQSGQALTAIKDHSGRVRRAFSRLRETVAIFRSLCTLTRVETARLSSDVSRFSDLADQVKPLSESIQSSGERVVAASSHLDHKVQEALRNAADLSARQ